MHDASSLLHCPGNLLNLAELDWPDVFLLVNVDAVVPAGLRLEEK
jgi:hypothetical protein